MNKEQTEAYEMIDKYKTSNPFELAELMGFTIEYHPLGSLRAFYRISRRNKFITLNSDLKSHQQPIECAHELGHYVMHREFNSFMLSSIGQSAKRFEKEADRFAVYVILKYRGIHSLRGLGVDQLAMMSGLEKYRLDLIKDKPF